MNRSQRLLRNKKARHRYRNLSEEQRRLRRAATRRYSLKNPSRARARVWRYNGINVEEALQRLARHKGRCELCGAKTPRRKGDWHIDHDHATNEIRGVLCMPCNTTLGKVERIGIKKIQRYLQRGTAGTRKTIAVTPR